jgi:hypothetical protein
VPSRPSPPTSACATCSTRRATSPPPSGLGEGERARGLQPYI